MKFDIKKLFEEPPLNYKVSLEGCGSRKSSCAAIKPKKVNVEVFWDKKLENELDDNLYDNLIDSKFFLTIKHEKIPERRFSKFFQKSLKPSLWRVFTGEFLVTILTLFCFYGSFHKNMAAFKKYGNQKSDKKFINI